MITNQEWSDKTDVFAFGIILWELLSGCRPYLQFAQLSVVELLVQIAGGARPDVSKISHVGRDLIRLIEQCWHQEPSQRPSMRRALDILRGNDPAAIFRSIDKDGSKSLDFGELVQFLQRYAPAVKPTEMADIFRAIDEDGSGGICFNEFQLFWKLVERNGLANALTLCQRARSRIS
jgi:serine/threonine protein kinase